MRLRWLSLLGLALPCAAIPLSNFGYLTNGMVSPEGNSISFMGYYDGRVHVNGAGNFNLASPPVFLGFYSQTAPMFDPSELGFQGGYAGSYFALSLDVQEDLENLRAHCLAHNHWPARQDSLALTTLIRFDGPLYHAAQFAQSQISGQDTLWQVPWVTIPLPWPPAPVAIVVEGVARVKGVVSGQVTLLAADSLFIMGDLITSDTILEPCPSDPPAWDSPFGTVPAGSPHRIGLIGEKDIIVAATLENGFANGVWSPTVDCGWPNYPVIELCQQGRRDVVITAALMALGCAFEVEYWKTTAFSATVPEPELQYGACSGYANTEACVWDVTPGGVRPDCLGANSQNDRRGTLFLHGSLTTNHAGYTWRTPVSPWGSVFIGYPYKVRRYDLNLLDAPPPWWPESDWLSALQVDVQLEHGSASACGLVNGALFAEDWNQGQVRLRLRSADLNNGQLRILTRVNGQVVDQALPEEGADAFVWWTPTLDLAPWLTEPGTVSLEVEMGREVGYPPQWDVYDSWNSQGGLCQWSWDATGVGPAAAPRAFSLSAAWPNPFNPRTSLELKLSQAQRLRCDLVDVAGRRVRELFQGELPGGVHQLEVDGEGLPSGLYLVRVEGEGVSATRKLLLVR